MAMGLSGSNGGIKSSNIRRISFEEIQDLKKNLIVNK